jgi:hypothetical protein
MVLFFMSGICLCKFSKVPTQGLECHNEHLDPLMRGQTEWFGVGCPTPMKSDRHKMKAFWVKSLQCEMVRVKVSQCLHWGGLMIRVPVFLHKSNFPPE